MTLKASAYHLSFNQLDDWIKLIRREAMGRASLAVAVNLRQPPPLRLALVVKQGHQDWSR